jgi:hypothetical protein
MPKESEYWCTNMTGAAKVLNRSRQAVNRYIKNGDISGFKYGSNTLIPMKDIAKALGTTQSRAVNLAKTWDLPLWRCKK